MNDQILCQLQQSAHLVLASSSAYQVREQQSMARLQRLRVRTYLQEYDLLFRYISRWLTRRGYELTGKQPHQVLARVCEQFVGRSQIEEMIRCRHLLKYHGLPPSEAATSTLGILLKYLGAEYL